MQTGDGMVPRRKFDCATLPPRPDLSFERALWEAGLHWVVGVDEAGRGALAGPVAAGAVVLPWNLSGLYERLHGVRDSKLMKAESRELWAEAIKDTAVAWGVGLASAGEIDRMGILPATHLAIERALESLECKPEHILVDYLRLPGVSTPQTALVKGDARSLSIASAAILAKTARDALMREMDSAYPGYGFASHKGYATRRHRQAIEAHGPCEQHRRTFAPVAAKLF